MRDFKIRGARWSPEEFSFLAPKLLREQGAGRYWISLYGYFDVDWEYEKYLFYYYNKSLILRVGLWMLMSNWDLVFLDIETTGLDHKEDKI